MSWMNDSLGSNLDRIAARKTYTETCEVCGTVSVYKISESDVPSPDGKGIRSDVYYRRISGGCKCEEKAAEQKKKIEAQFAAIDKKRLDEELLRGKNLWETCKDADPGEFFEYDLNWDCPVSVADYLQKVRLFAQALYGNGVEIRVVVHEKELVAIQKISNRHEVICSRKRK